MQKEFTWSQGNSWLVYASERSDSIKTVDADSLLASLLTLALFLVAFLIPTSPEIGGIGLRPEDLLLVALGVVLFVDLLARPEIRLRGGQFFGALSALWLLSALATLVGALLGTATLLSIDPIESGLLTVIKEAELLVLFVLAVRYVQSKRTAHLLVSTLCLGSATLASLVVLETVALQRGALVPPQQFHLMGELFGFGASLAAGRLFFGTVSGRERLFFAGILGITLVGVLVSGEAGAMVGATAALAMMAFVALDRSSLRVSTRLLALAGGVTLVVVSAVLLAIPEFTRIAANQFADLFSILAGDPRFSTQVRFRNWGDRIPEVLTQRPLLGFGQMAIPPGGLDNEYFQRLYYTGLLGLGAYLYLLLTATRTAFSAADRDETGFVAGYAGVVGVMLGAGLAKGVFHSTKTTTFFVLCSALVYVLLDRDGFTAER